MIKVKVTDAAARLIIETGPVDSGSHEFEFVAVATDAFAAWAKNRDVTNYTVHIELDYADSQNPTMSFYVHFEDDQDAVLYRLDWSK